MITTTYHRAKHRLTVNGHAENGDPSHDMLCASASTLTLTLAAALIDLSMAGLIAAPHATLERGEADLHCQASHSSRGAVLLTFDTVARGFALLANHYPAQMTYEEL